MGLMDRFTKKGDDYEIPDDDDLGGEIDVSTSVSYGNLDEAQVVIDESIKSNNSRYEQMANQIKDKGIMQTSSADGLNKDDNPLAYYIKQIEQMDNTVKLFSAKVEAMKRIDAKRQKEWEKMKEVSFDMQTLVRNIEQGLGGGDISSNDINEIVSRVLSRVNRKLDTRDKHTSTKEKIQSNKKPLTKIAIIKYVIFGTILVSFISTVIFLFSLYSGVGASNVKTTKDTIKGLSITKTVKSNAIVYCKPKNGDKYAKYKIGKPIVDAKGKLDTDNKFNFIYQGLLCKADSKDLS